MSVGLRIKWLWVRIPLLSLKLQIGRLLRARSSFTSFKAFLKSKKKSGTSLPASFSAWILNKNILLVIFYYLTKCHCLVAFTTWGIGQYVYCNYLVTFLWRHKFWKYPYLLIKSFFLYIINNSPGNVNSDRAWNSAISPTFLVWKICGKAQFPQSSGRITVSETVPFRKVFTLEN